MQSQSPTHPVGIKAPHGADALEIRWADGTLLTYPHRVLRGYCPCAGCQGHGGPIRFVSGGNQDLRNIEQVGNYALGLSWGDGHSTGIYSFTYLRRLGDLLARHGATLLEELGELPRA